MTEYRVTWTIEVDADDPEGAALKARYYQTKPGTTATVFHVARMTALGPTAHFVTVDLHELDTGETW